MLGEISRNPQEARNWLNANFIPATTVRDVWHLPKYRALDHKGHLVFAVMVMLVEYPGKPEAELRIGILAGDDIPRADIVPNLSKAVYVPDEELVEPKATIPGTSLADTTIKLH